jgi:hyperosmotically inducible periplasmic protein
MKAMVLGLSLAALLCSCGKQESQAADNTARNERDKSGETLVPTDQAENAADLGLTQAVRQALMDDTMLSVDGKNVKVISKDGVVTLRGPVASQEEKDRIDAKVRGLAGVTRVDDQLEIKVE